MKIKQNPESRGRTGHSWVNVLVLACGLAACGQSRPTPDANSTEAVRGEGAAAHVQTADLENLEVRLAPHTGDIDEMDKRRVVRALVSFNKTTFFFDGERPRGMTYDALVEFEKFLNRKLHPNDRTGKEKIHVVLVPTTPSKVASDLQNGFGDIVAMAVYITEERKKIADFVPLASSRHDVIVSGASAPQLAGLDDLSGKEVCVVKESLAWENLTGTEQKIFVCKESQDQPVTRGRQSGARRYPGNGQCRIAAVRRRPCASRATLEERADGPENLRRLPSYRQDGIWLGGAQGFPQAADIARRVRPLAS